MEVEQSADPLVGAARNSQDPALQKAVKEAHQKASGLKHQMQG